MKIIKTTDSQYKPPVIMLVYGEGGVGKTTFAATAPKPLMADCEGGTKYLGLRGIDLDVVQVESWTDMKLFFEALKDYETAIIDPIGELMEKLKRFMIQKGDRKLVQADGSPSIAGWGWLKEQLRAYLKLLRDSGKNVLIIAHVEEKMDDNRLIKRPSIATKIADEIVNMVDVAGYMTIIRDATNDESKRVIIVDAESDKFTAKDRTGQLGKYIEPDFTKIINACQGNATYSWSKQIGERKEETNERFVKLLDAIQESDHPNEKAVMALKTPPFEFTDIQREALQNIINVYE